MAAQNASISDAEFAEQHTIPPPHQIILGTTAQLLLEDSDPDTLAQTLFEALHHPLRLDAYFHYLVSPDARHLELVSCGGNDLVRDILGSKLELGEGISGLVARTGKGIVVSNLEDSADPMTVLLRSFGIRCYTCNPLLLHDRLLGTFSFGSSRRDHFTPSELGLLELIVQQVTLATERRLQNLRQREIDRQTAVGRMSATLAGEMRTPLESLVNLLSQLRAEMPSPEAQELLENAEQELARLTSPSLRTWELFRNQENVPPKNMAAA